MTIQETALGGLRGRTAVMIGGARIGRTIGRALAEQGMHLAATYFKEESEIAPLLEEARALGVRTLAVQMDVSDRASVEAGAKQVEAEFGSVHLLLNMASVFRPVEFEQIGEADWAANIGAHLTGGFWPAQAFAPLMPKGGKMIFVADRTSIGKMYPGYLPYAATKSAVVGLVRALATELAPRGIAVNAIAPGPMLRPADIPEAEWRGIRASSPLKTDLTDEIAVAQFAWLVLYLAANELATGHTYPLDQGFNL